MKSQIIKVFISCSSDVEEEAQCVIKVCDRLSEIFMISNNLEFKTIYWKDAKAISRQITGSRTQELINGQLEDYA